MFGKLWRNYGLSIVLFALFLLCWGLQTLAGWHEFAAQQAAHGQVPALLGADGYGWRWAQATMENWQSEMLQLFTFVVLATYLIHRGSPQSRDGTDEMRRQLDRIEQRVARIEQPGPAPVRTDRAA